MPNVTNQAVMDTAVAEAKQAVELAPVVPKMLPRRRAINITMSNGYVLQLREVGYENMPVYFRAVPALEQLTDLFRAAMVTNADGEETVNLFALPPIPQDVMEALLPLCLVMSGLSADDFNMLPLEDTLPIMFGVYQFAPKNSAADQGN